ncbi:MAG: hypothetical protein WCT20_03730 [Candidatus Babeliales bacterium]
MDNLEKKEAQKSPLNFKMLRGLLAIVLGVISLIMSYKVLLAMVFFIVGLILIYVGLHLLELDYVLKTFDTGLEKIKKYL